MKNASLHSGRHNCYWPNLSFAFFLFWFWRRRQIGENRAQKTTVLPRLATLTLSRAAALAAAWQRAVNNHKNATINWFFMKHLRLSEEDWGGGRPLIGPLCHFSLLCPLKSIALLVLQTIMTTFLLCHDSDLQMSPSCLIYTATTMPTKRI